jgi:hypothetical protein
MSGGANIQNAGSQVGFSPFLNFAGTAVASVAIASNTATITVNGVAGGGTVVVLQSGTVVGNETGINFTGLTATFGNTASTATIPLDTAFGQDRSVQFNNAGHMSGADKLDIDAQGYLVLQSQVSGGTIPPTPAAGNLTIFPRQKAGRNLLSYIGPSGLDGPYQPMIGMNKVYLIQPYGSANAGLTYVGHVSGVLSGVLVAAPALNTTNFSSSLRRVEISCTNLGAGSQAGIVQAVAPHWLGNVPGAGGFFIVMRLNHHNTGSIANQRFFAGMVTGVAFGALNNVDFAAYVNAFGVIKNATGTTYNFFHCDATTANNRQIDTGITYNVGDVLEVRLFAKPSATQVNMSLEIISVGGSGTVGAGPFAEYATTGNLTAIPTNTTFLTTRVSAGTAAATQGARVGVISIYGETDW